MADKKPDAKKSAGAKPSSAGTGHMFETELKIFLVVAFIVIIYLAVGRDVLQSLGYDQSDSIGYVSTTLNEGFNIFNGIFNLVIFFSVFIILLFILGSFYYKHKHREIVTLYKMGLPKGYISSLSSTASLGVVDKPTESNEKNNLVDESGKPVLNSSGENKKWDQIQKHIASMNPSDWRVAILEADILLYEMLDQMGYDGDTIAEKLKLIEASDFNTLDLAWRAHKVRNAISHEGSSYEMSYEQAQNTIELYKKVFEEFYFI
jgi:hypothetical protein